MFSQEKIEFIIVIVPVEYEEGSESTQRESILRCPECHYCSSRDVLSPLRVVGSVCAWGSFSSWQANVNQFEWFTQYMAAIYSRWLDTVRACMLTENSIGNFTKFGWGSRERGEENLVVVACYTFPWSAVDGSLFCVRVLASVQHSARFWLASGFISAWLCKGTRALQISSTELAPNPCGLPFGS